jgi:hypothetical protein
MGGGYGDGGGTGIGFSMPEIDFFGAKGKGEKVVFETKTDMDLTSSKPALIFGVVVCIMTVALYVIFW